MCNVIQFCWETMCATNCKLTESPCFSTNHSPLGSRLIPVSMQLQRLHFTSRPSHLDPHAFPQPSAILCRSNDGRYSSFRGLKKPPPLLLLHFTQYNYKRLNANSYAVRSRSHARACWPAARAKRSACISRSCLRPMNVFHIIITVGWHLPYC